MDIKTVQRILAILLMVIMLVSTVSTVAMALTPSQIKGDGQQVTSSTIESAGKKIVGILQTVGIVLSVIILIIIGIKYMMGSAEEKADYKKTLMPYIIGAALIFAASVFAQVAYDFFTGLNSAAGTTNN